MFNRRTLFILGAGASKEVKLPLGSELVDIIYGKLNLMRAQTHGDKRLLETLTWYAPNGKIDPYVSAAQKIADGLPLLHSIDDYLEIHQDDELIQFVGKLAIVKSIMDAEEASPLYVAGVDRRG